MSAGICQHSGWKNARVGDRQASLRDRVEKFIGEHLEGFGDRPPPRLRPLESEAEWPTLHGLRWNDRPIHSRELYRADLA